MVTKVLGETEECFRRAKQVVRGGSLGNLFATNGVLLVRECQ